jgi:hypothetical protein
MQSLLALNRMALEFAARDKGDPDAVPRINFGLYFYNGPSSFNGLDSSGTGQGERTEKPSQDG